MTPPTSTNAEISAVTDKDSNTQVPVSAGFCRSLTMQGLRRVGIADLAGGRRASRNAGQERSSECRVIACCPWFHNSRRRAGARSSRAVPDAACGRASALVKRQNDVGEDVEGAAGGSSCTQILAQSLTYACKHALIASSAAGALPDLLVHGGGYNFASRCTPDEDDSPANTPPTPPSTLTHEAQVLLSRAQERFAMEQLEVFMLSEHILAAATVEPEADAVDLQAKELAIQRGYIRRDVLYTDVEERGKYDRQTLNAGRSDRHHAVSRSASALHRCMNMCRTGDQSASFLAVTV
eukprot:2624611-Rhodomonas_salina.2